MSNTSLTVPSEFRTREKTTTRNAWSVEDLPENALAFSRPHFYVVSPDLAGETDAKKLASYSTASYRTPSVMLPASAIRDGALDIAGRHPGKTVLVHARAWTKETLNGLRTGKDWEDKRDAITASAPDAFSGLSNLAAFCAAAFAKSVNNAASCADALRRGAYFSL